MKKIILFDTTLRDGEQAPGYSMQTEEKTEIATALEKLGIDIIEGGFAASSEGDLNAIKKICDAVKDSEIASLARASESDIDAAEKALKNAVLPVGLLTIGDSAFYGTSLTSVQYDAEGVRIADDGYTVRIKATAEGIRQINAV